jgi:histone-lysine N-methyltransferase ASH1L
MTMTPEPAARAEVTRASSSDSVLSAITVDDSSHDSSTPPTSIGDSVSVSSSSLKLENADSTSADQSMGRSRRPRTSVGTYNVKVLSGTAIHAPKKYCKNKDEIEARRRTISGDTLVGALSSGNSSTESVEKDANRLVRDGIDALDLEWSVKVLPKSRSQISLGDSPRKTAKQLDLARRKSTRSSGEQLENLTRKLSVLGKRGRKTFEDGLAKAKRELRNLADTNEFAKIDTKPVVHEVWSNGKLVTAEPTQKKMKKAESVATEVAKVKLQPEEEKLIEKKKVTSKREKIWLNKGLYAGQEARNFDWFQDSLGKDKENMDEIAPYKPNSFMPLPMWHGQRLLHVGRHFKLPFDVCSPLPPGQPKPDEWRKTSSSKWSLCLS